MFYFMHFKFQFIQKLMEIRVVNYHVQAEAAAAAGESSFRSFMVAVQRCGSSVAIVQQVCLVSWLFLIIKFTNERIL